MNAKLDILMIAVATLFSTTTAEGVIPSPDFQVLEGDEARFIWQYEGAFDISSDSLYVYDTDGITALVTFVAGIESAAEGSEGLVGMDVDIPSKRIILTIFKATSSNTGSYKIDVTYSVSAYTYSAITKLTVITVEEYEAFKMGSSLKINKDIALGYDSKTNYVAPGDISLASTVPNDYTQTTTCTHTSSGIKGMCGTSCTSLTCTYNVYDTKVGDVIDLKILLDGFDDSKSYGYTVFVDGSKTALASNQQASLMYITFMILIIWICG